MCLKFLLLFLVFGGIHGHGYLTSPAARNSMWRFGFANPINYNDNGLNCGGRIGMHQNGGRCGVCGDAVNAKIQRHMDGGRYANRIISATYKSGEVISVSVLLTTSHMGHFEFRVGDFSNKPTTGDSSGKLNGQLLKLSSGATEFPVTKNGRYLYTAQLKLPDGLVCERCVFQWWYRGGNSWGCGSTGCGKGLGAQEHFVNCADIKITA